jgi:hypothetical protein
MYLHRGIQFQLEGMGCYTAATELTDIKQNNYKRGMLTVSISNK